MKGSSKYFMNKKNIFIIDYEMGNAQSVKNALNKINVKSKIISTSNTLSNCDAIILPGVGSFKQAVYNLIKKELFNPIDDLVKNKKTPFLGICLGMQLIGKDSTENGLTKGFGWIDGRVRRIDLDSKYRLPHVGWNEINKEKEASLLSRVKDLSNYYFDHTYSLICDNTKLVSSTVKYGNKKIISSIEYENIFGTQFHPEKSQLIGLRVLKAFCKLI